MIFQAFGEIFGQKGGSKTNVVAPTVRLTQPTNPLTQNQPAPIPITQGTRWHQRDAMAPTRRLTQLGEGIRHSVATWDIRTRVLLALNCLKTASPPPR
ncbi:unnamed protein product, partial [Eruca vesicaria subsp. sativa]|nr:unnamed protein product [Eruca vesicaria subsp. sativa]